MSTKSVNINAILAAPEHSRSSPRGAPMGASDYMDAPESKLHLQRIRFVDGDYGPDGTYWGGGGHPCGAPSRLKPRGRMSWSTACMSGPRTGRLPWPRSAPCTRVRDSSASCKPHVTGTFSQWR